MGNPDMVLEMQENYEIPASGTVNYKYLYVPTNFTETKYVQAVEVRPGTGPWSATSSCGRWRSPT